MCLANERIEKKIHFSLRSETKKKKKKKKRLTDIERDSHKLHLNSSLSNAR